MNTPAKRYIPAWVALGIGLALSVLASLEVKTVIEDGAKKQLAFTADQVTLKVRERLNSYALVLKSGAGVFASSEVVSRKEWKAYVEKLRAEDSVPGVQGIGFAQLIQPRQLAAHVAGIRAEGFPDYVVRPAGERALYTSIIYLEPFRDRNLRAFGFDMFSEPVRRAAMEQARDGGVVALSGKVELVQEIGNEVQAGTLMYVPVYRNGAPTTTVEEKRAALIGWVYSPYRMGDLMDGILADWNKREGRSIAFHVFDGSEAAAVLELFDSDPAFIRHTHTAIRSALFQQRTIDFGGRQWLLTFDTTDGAAGQSYVSAWATLLGGALFSGLLFVLILTLSNRQARAEEIAARLTEDVRRNADLLRVSEFRWKFAVEGSGDGLWDWNIPVSTVFFSTRWKEMLGFNGDEIGNSLDEWSQRVHPDDLERVMTDVKAHLDGKTAHYINEHRVRSKDGGYKWILDRGLVVERDAAGKPLRMIGTHTDITLRKQAENLLRLSEARYHSLFDNSHAVMLIIDPDNGAIVAANPAAAAYYGWPQDQLIRMDISQINTLSATEIQAEMLLAKTQQRNSFEFRHRRADGTVRDVEVFSGPVLVEGRQLLYTIVHDVSARKIAEAELARHLRHLEEIVGARTADLVIAKEAAEAASRAKTTFLANMSHELRTPLNGIMGMIGMALRRIDDPQIKDRLTKADQAAQNLLAIVNDVLDISKIEAERLTLDSVDFHVGGVLENVRSLLAPKVQEKKLALVIVLPEDVAALHVQGDPLRLGQILLNLMGNAVKFTDTGTIEVSVTRQPDADGKIQLRFAIKDSGIGINLEDQRRIFKAFEQADASMTRKHGGTGLGLAICKRLVSLMGGDIQVQSEVGNGSTFAFTARFSAGREMPPAGLTIDAESKVKSRFAGSSPTGC